MTTSRAISRGMLEGLEMPNDTITEEDGRISAEVDIYELRN